MTLDLNETRIDVYETLCPQQMLVHEGGKIKHCGVECSDVTPTQLQYQNIFKEHWGLGGQDGCKRRNKVFEKILFFFGGGGGSGWGGGQGRCEQRSEVFVKIQKKIKLGGGGGGSGRGVTGWM